MVAESSPARHVLFIVLHTPSQFLWELAQVAIKHQGLGSAGGTGGSEPCLRPPYTGFCSGRGHSEPLKVVRAQSEPVPVLPTLLTGLAEAEWSGKLGVAAARASRSQIFQVSTQILPGAASQAVEAHLRAAEAGRPLVAAADTAAGPVAAVHPAGALAAMGEVAVGQMLVM